MRRTQRSRWGLFVLGAVALSSLAACGGPQQTARAGGDSGSTAAGEAPTSEAAATSTTAAPAGEAWPLVGGGTLDIATLSDQPLALWFWAPG